MLGSAEDAGEIDTSACARRRERWVNSGRVDTVINEVPTTQRNRRPAIRAADSTVHALVHENPPAKVQPKVTSVPSHSLDRSIFKNVLQDNAKVNGENATGSGPSFDTAAEFSSTNVTGTGARSKVPTPLKTEGVVDKDLIDLVNPDLPPVADVDITEGKMNDEAQEDIKSVSVEAGKPTETLPIIFPNALSLPPVGSSPSLSNIVLPSVDNSRTASTVSVKGKYATFPLTNSVIEIFYYLLDENDTPNDQFVNNRFGEVVGVADLPPTHADGSSKGRKVIKARRGKATVPAGEPPITRSQTKYVFY